MSESWYEELEERAEEARKKRDEEAEKQRRELVEATEKRNAELQSILDNVGSYLAWKEAADKKAAEIMEEYTRKQEENLDDICRHGVTKENSPEAYGERYGEWASMLKGLEIEKRNEQRRISERISKTDGTNTTTD